MKTIVIYLSKRGDINGFNFQYVDKTEDEAREAVNALFEKTVWLKQYNVFEVFEISDFHYDFIQYCLRDKYDMSGKHVDKPENIELEEARKRISELEYDMYYVCTGELKEIKNKIGCIIDNIENSQIK